LTAPSGPGPSRPGPERPEFDLLIVGGGLVGASLAIALSGQGLRIGLLDAAPLGVDSQPNYDDRGIALAYGSSRIFAGLGIWPALRERAEPIRRIHVSDRGHFGFTRLVAEEEGVEALGYVITAKAIGQVLLAELDERAARGELSLINPARVTDIEPDDDRVRLDIQHDGERRRLSAGLLVAADGAQSFVRERLGIKTRQWRYDQHAVVANITPSRPHEGVAYERFTEEGPVALLPMSEQRCALVWTLSDARLDEIMGLDDSAFVDAFQGRFGYRLGRFVKVGRRQSYPLSFLRALEASRPRVAVIGNAAHTLHPIAGQGLNLGLRDVAALAEEIAAARGRGVAAAGVDVGAEPVLRAYDHWRRRDQQAVSLATDGLVRLFTNPLGPLRVARNLGMVALDSLPFAKHALARGAMGVAGRLPRLARGLSLD
jgi:2-octaprenyl-6-methoxyphenol hydroxylase